MKQWMAFVNIISYLGEYFHLFDMQPILSATEYFMTMIICIDNDTVDSGYFPIRLQYFLSVYALNIRKLD